MASSTAAAAAARVRVSHHLVVIFIFLFFAFYFHHHRVRENHKSAGISQFVTDDQRSGAWNHDGLDSGSGEGKEMEGRVLWLILRLMWLIGLVGYCVVDAIPRRILLDTDVDTDDFFALFYVLKQNRSEFDLKAVTVNANAWSDAGHAVNHVYDILYMMDRNDISVGVGGDGGILSDGTIRPNVGGYLPLVEQGMSTVGDCRYRQAIPIVGGRLHIDTNYGIRRSFLPQGIFSRAATSFVGARFQLWIFLQEKRSFRNQISTKIR